MQLCKQGECIKCILVLAWAAIWFQKTVERQKWKTYRGLGVRWKEEIKQVIWFKKRKYGYVLKKHLRFEKYVVVLNKRNLMVFYYILINFVAYLIFQEGFSCANVIII